MEQLEDEDFLVKRNANKHFETCLNLIDNEDLLGAITSIEKAVNLHPENDIFIHLSRNLSRLYDLASSAKEFDDNKKFNSTDSKKHSLNLHGKPGSSVNDKSNVGFPSIDDILKDTNWSLESNYQKQTTHHDGNLAGKRNITSGNCLHCQSSCEEKPSISDSTIPMEKEGYEPPVNNVDKGEILNDCCNCNKAQWFPNPAKYNIDGFNVDARFFEEVCKQRESSDGWDTYMKLLNDLSQDDDSDVSEDFQNITRINGFSNDNHHYQSGSNSSSNTYKRTDKFTEQKDEEMKSRNNLNSFKGCSYKDDRADLKKSENGFSTSNSTKKSPQEEEQKRIYFRNGKECYGIPPANYHSNDKSRPKMDPSEDEFYRNLRFHFRCSSENPKPTKSTCKKTTVEETSPLNSSSTKPCFTSNASKADTSSSACKAKDDDETPGTSKEYQYPTTTEPNRSSPFVDVEKADLPSGSHNSKTFCENPQLEEKPQKGFDSNVKKIPVKSNEKTQNSSDKSGKKVHKNKDVLHEDNMASKSRIGKKHKKKFLKSDKNEQIPGKERTTRMSKEEMIKKISNSNESTDLKEMTWQTGKKIVSTTCSTIIVIIIYAILILLIALTFTVKGLFRIIKCLLDFIMSFRISVTVMHKLSLVKSKVIVNTYLFLLWLIGWYYSFKSRCSRWYFAIRRLGVREFFFGRSRPPQTYNLPNSGDDAIQQLLQRKGCDPYSILGIPKEASNDDIRRQYRKLAVFVHPDKNPHVHAAEAFRILCSAYDIIGDPGVPRIPGTLLHPEYCGQVFDEEKRLEFDREAVRRESYQSSRDYPKDFKDPMDFFADLMRKMEEVRESLYCDVCERRHRRILTDRSVLAARCCYSCNRMHPAKEGDFWKESTFLGLGTPKFYACMEGQIYDISVWGLCQERNGFNLPADSHRVLGRISTRSQHRHPPPPSFEEDFFRDLFGQQDRHSGSHGNQNNRSKQPRPRRRKRK